jgi:PAS domain S-box-containing protein
MPFRNTGTLLLTLDGQIAFASTYFCEIVGVPLGDAPGKSWLDYVFPEDRGAACDLFERAKLADADPIRFRLRRLNGTQILADVQAAPVYAPGDIIYAVTATITSAKGNR